MIKVNCLRCGNEILDYLSKNRKYCSKKCHSLHNKILRKGKGNPMWGRIPENKKNLKITNSYHN